MVQILTTSGDSHPAERWAEASTAQIMTLVHVAPSAAPDAIAKKEMLRADVYAVLAPFYNAVRDREWDELLVPTSGASLADTTPWADQINATVASILGSAQSLFGDHFAKPEVDEFVRQIVNRHVGTIMSIERQWYCDENPDNAHVQAYRASLAA